MCIRDRFGDVDDGDGFLGIRLSPCPSTRDMGHPGRCGFFWGSAADGREEGDFVSVGEGVSGGDVFLIDGYGDGGPRNHVGGDKTAAAAEEIADGGSGGEFEGACGGAEVIAESAEGEELSLIHI